MLPSRMLQARPNGQTDATTFKKEVLDPLIGEDPDKMRMVPSIRRLHGRAYALEAADQLRTVEGKPETGVALHPAERDQRRRDLAGRISGFALCGRSDPADKLIDKFAEMLQRNVVRYVAWEVCGSRDDEIRHHDPEGVETLKVKQGALTFEPRRVDAIAGITTDLLLTYALRRRALAADIAGLIKFETMDLWNEKMLAAFLQEPLPGRARVSLAQLKAADERVFQMIATKCGADLGLNTERSATKFEEAFRTAIFDFEIHLLLAPLAAPASVAAASFSTSSSSRGQASQPNNKMQQRIDQLEREKANLKRKLDHDNSKGKCKGKKSRRGRGQESRPTAPEGLRGMSTKTPAGENICFSFNLPVGCKHAAAGAKCAKGWHTCAFPGCNQPHSLCNHPR